MKIHKAYFTAIVFMYGLVVAAHAHSSAKDPVLVGMAFLDVLTEVVTDKTARRSYLDYQHQRYGLSYSERFPASFHAKIVHRPLCANGQGAESFLNQECMLYQVVDRKIGCKPSQKNCLAFRLADFVAQDRDLMLAIAGAFNQVGDVIADPESLDRKYGARDLQTPGLTLSPHGLWTVLRLDKNTPRTGRLQRLENGVFAMSFD
ncbi:hypothetical protein [Telluria beijingensis]|uniref:hypothetical protein n=1 Tax=Telluria beijingensis TaxID=3068633 RepID=UPI002795CCF0|nr:hypothetical protein [Massilia sp. REN29]